MDQFIYRIFERGKDEPKYCSQGVSQHHQRDFDSESSARDEGGFMGHDRYPKETHKVNKYKLVLVEEDI